MKFHVCVMDKFGFGNESCVLKNIVDFRGVKGVDREETIFVEKLKTKGSYYFNR